MKTLKELQDNDAQRQKELVAMKQVRTLSEKNTDSLFRARQRVTPFVLPDIQYRWRIIPY
jgi:hypothetical protein